MLRFLYTVAAIVHQAENEILVYFSPVAEKEECRHKWSSRNAKHVRRRWSANIVGKEAEKSNVVVVK